MSELIDRLLKSSKHEEQSYNACAGTVSYTHLDVYKRQILYSAAQLSSLNASKLLKSENIKVCKSSICDLLKKNAIHCG